MITKTIVIPISPGTQEGHHIQSAIEGWERQGWANTWISHSTTHTYIHFERPEKSVPQQPGKGTELVFDQKWLDVRVGSATYQIDVRPLSNGLEKPLHFSLPVRKV